VTDSWSSGAKLTLWAWLASLAACISLGPLVTTKSFLLAGAVAGLAVATVGGVGRWLRLPVPMVLVLQVFALLEWATVSYAAGPAWATFAPTRESMSVLVGLVQAALATAQEYAPPAPATTGIEASLAFVVGSVALVVDLLGVSWRRPALIGLAFLGVYMAPVALLAGEVPVLAFAPGALAFVFLLGAEQRDRVTHWGRQIGIAGTLLSTRDRRNVSVSTLIQSGRRVGLGAVALAVVLPALIPTLPRTFLADGPLSGDDGSRGGDGTLDLENPLLDLRRNLGERSEDVLVTMRTSGEVPKYLRIASLDTFTGDSWEPSEREPDNAVPLDEVPAAPPGLLTPVDRDRVASRITISESFTTTWLPTLYPLTTATAEGDWSVDAAELDISASADDVDAAGLTYESVSTLVLPTGQELASTGPPSQDMERYLELPDELPAVVSDLAEQVTAKQPSRFEKAQSLQDWFRTGGGFEYTLEPGPADGLDAIETFLTDDRRGYCEQFAASMALMARSVGIPSRVAVGFLRPELRADGGWEFQGLDMHAWPELYFEGIGWVLFEPTPAARSGAAPDRGSATGDDATSPTTRRPQDTRTLPRESVAVPPSDAGSTGGDGAGSTSQRLRLLGGLVLLAAVIVLAPRTARAARRARRWRRAGAGGESVPEVAWRELGDSSVDLGIRVDPRSTLRTSGRALRSRVDDEPAAVAALNRLVIGVERARFAPGASAGYPPAADARHDVDLVVARLTAGRTPGQRRRGAWLPASLLPRGGWHSGARGDHGAQLLRTEEQASG